MNDQDRDLIRAYISGALPKDRRRAVEERIAKDKAFRRKVLAEKEKQTTRTSVSSGTRSKERNRVEASSPVEVEPGIASRNRGWWIIAAAIVLIAAGVYYLVQNKSTASGDLFSEYFEPYPLSAYTVATEGEEAVPAALEAYQEGDYQEAINRFEATEPTMSTALSYSFYYALSLIGGERGSEAVPILQGIIQEESGGAISQPAEWYLALAYLQSGQKDEAVRTLDRIAGQPDHEMSNKAEMLIAELQASR